MKCSVNLSNVTPEQLPTLITTLTTLGISFHLHYHQESENEFSTPISFASARLQVTPVKINKPPSNPSMLCAHANCSKVGGFYNRESHPRVYYCTEHKPDESYKTHKTFTVEGLRGHFCGSTESSSYRKRVRQETKRDYDEDEWLESRNPPYLSDRLVVNDSTDPKTPERE